MSTMANFFRQQTSVAICALLALLTVGASMFALNGRAYAQGRRYSLIPFRSKTAPLTISKVNNLQGEHFLRDLEIEVTNVSDKPIYFIRLLLVLPEVKMRGKTSGFALYYGRLDLVDLDQRAEPDDKPLQPGETYVFKVPDPIWQGYEQYYFPQNNISTSVVSTIKLRLDTISFGDGTGYEAGGDFYKSQKVKFVVPGKSKPASRDWLKKTTFIAGGPLYAPQWNDCPGHQSTCDRFRIERNQSFCVPINGPPVCRRTQAVVDRTMPCRKYVEYPFNCGGTGCEDDFLDLCDDNDGL
jgi:hypothetical protein